LKALYISLIVVIFDQISKFLVKGIKIPWLGINFEGMTYGSSKQVIGNFIKITFIENPGMAFGLDVGPKMFLTIFTIIASIVILYYIFKHRNDGKLIRISLAFILAGAIGNLIDRTFYGMIYKYAPLFFGRVVDFVQIDFWKFTIFGRTYTSWPIFNIADVSVTVGFFIILLFHKKIFKHQDDSPVLASNIGNIHNVNNVGEQELTDNFNLNSQTKVEDTTSNPDQSPPGPEKT
jgi:signal peptidase II